MPEPKRYETARNPQGLLIAVLAVFFCAVFVSLGVWQVERLSWKRDLIARVDARIHAPATPIPEPDQWPKLTAKNDAYKHVSATGRLQNDKESLVYTSTLLGPGYWVLTPLIREDGTAILVNRGYVPLDHKDPETRPEAPVSKLVTITGLLRLNEPDGTFLRSNVPDQNRWYSRDVRAMAKAHGILTVAPFFIDADASPAVTSAPRVSPLGELPIGGLTVVKFPNSHLSYAITWFTLALLSLVGGVVAVRFGRDTTGHSPVSQQPTHTETH
ncbi:SURF1 family protein [Roseibium algae]|uniref:SURF1-like protein n=1 Tax=Roseibium algae TaxID=3123038 RepID=A0ABU8TJB7_9HYPH